MTRTAALRQTQLATQSLYEFLTWLHQHSNVVHWPASYAEAMTMHEGWLEARLHGQVDKSGLAV